jgi:hypothetical protein
MADLICAENKQGPFTPMRNALNRADGSHESK